MVDKKPAEATPASIARANRRRLALEEGTRAMADIEQKAIAVRKNMQRLRALREAKEGNEATSEAAVAVKKKRGKTLSR